MPCAAIYSPTLKGFKSKISTPPAKLTKLPCKAKTTAKAVAPTTAIKEIVLIPTIEATLICNMMVKMALSINLRKGIRVESASHFSYDLPVRLMTHWISNSPMINTRIAKTNLGTYAINKDGSEFSAFGRKSVLIFDYQC